MLKEASAKNVAKFETREQSDQLPMSHFNALGAIKKVYNKHHEDLILTNEGANSLDDCRSPSHHTCRSPNDGAVRACR